MKQRGRGFAPPRENLKKEEGMKRLFWALVLPALVFAGTVQLSGAANADFLDEFSVPQLDPGWRIHLEDSTNWSLTARPGFLRIITQYCTGDSIKNTFFHLEGIAGNFVATTKVIARPDSAGQCTYIHADTDSLAQRRPRAIAGFGNIAGYGEGFLGWIDASMVLVPHVDTMAYLRIRTNGDTVFAEYSLNNSNWVTLNSAWSPPFTELQEAGVGAMNYAPFGATPSTPEITADFDWFHLVAQTGVEEKTGVRDQGLGVRVTARPNPFLSFATVPGHSTDRFALYDISGRRVGVYRGDRIGADLPPGVYFIKPLNQDSKPLRIVKLR